MTGVQTCALPIYGNAPDPDIDGDAYFGGVSQYPYLRPILKTAISKISFPVKLKKHRDFLSILTLSVCIFF